MTPFLYIIEVLIVTRKFYNQEFIQQSAQARWHRGSFQFTRPRHGQSPLDCLANEDHIVVGEPLPRIRSIGRVRSDMMMEDCG